MTDSGPTPFVVEKADLSIAWACVFDRLMQPGVTEMSPLVLSVTGFTPDGRAIETPSVREAVDSTLLNLGKRDSENVAFTIFPQSYWEITKGDRKAFFDLYRRSFLRIQDYNPKNNRKGSYFQRLIDFEGGGEGRNQLAWILDEYSRNPASRKSKWQATTYDPYRDVSSTAQLEFPCLQQVSFTFVRPNGLVVNAFYATQQILRKGYGNYLGLSRLGAFMAEEMGRSLARVNVFVGVAQMDNDIGKTSSLIEPVVESVRDVLRSESGRWAA